MFGFFIGTACILGLAVMAARGRRYRHGYGAGHHGGFRRRGLRRVLERLDTSPGQEKAILIALDALRDRGKEMAQGLGETRKSVAAALRAEQLDPRAFAAIFDEPLARVSALREELTKAVATIHETLTPRQKEQLSSLVEAGPPWGYGHRHAC
jgi:Spy/CpxP family protein refolding chaperone